MSENNRKVSHDSNHSDTSYTRNNSKDDPNRAEHFKHCRFIRQVCQRVEVTGFFFVKFFTLKLKAIEPFFYFALYTKIALTGPKVSYC